MSLPPAALKLSSPSSQSGSLFSNSVQSPDPFASPPLNMIAENVFSHTPAEHPINEDDIIPIETSVVNLEESFSETEARKGIAESLKADGNSRLDTTFAMLGRSGSSSHNSSFRNSPRLGLLKGDGLEPFSDETQTDTRPWQQQYNLEFGEVVWAQNETKFPYWPAFIFDPEKLPSEIQASLGVQPNSGSTRTTPTRVISALKKKIPIYFYGKNDYDLVHPSKLKPYAKHRDECLKSNMQHTAAFQKGVKLADEDILKDVDKRVEWLFAKKDAKKGTPSPLNTTTTRSAGAKATPPSSQDSRAASASVANKTTVASQNNKKDLSPKSAKAAAGTAASTPPGKKAAAGSAVSAASGKKTDSKTPTKQAKATSQTSARQQVAQVASESSMAVETTPLTVDCSNGSSDATPAAQEDLPSPGQDVDVILSAEPGVAEILYSRDPADLLEGSGIDIGKELAEEHMEASNTGAEGHHSTNGQQSQQHMWEAAEPVVLRSRSQDSNRSSHREPAIAVSEQLLDSVLEELTAADAGEPEINHAAEEAAVQNTDSSDAAIPTATCEESHSMEVASAALDSELLSAERIEYASHRGNDSNFSEVEAVDSPVIFHAPPLAAAPTAVVAEEEQEEQVSGDVEEEAALREETPNGEEALEQQVEEEAAALQEVSLDTPTPAQEKAVEEPAPEPAEPLPERLPAVLEPARDLFVSGASDSLFAAPPPSNLPSAKPKVASPASGLFGGGSSDFFSSKAPAGDSFAAPAPATANAAKPVTPQRAAPPARNVTAADSLFGGSAPNPFPSMGSDPFASAPAASRASVKRPVVSSGDLFGPAPPTAEPTFAARPASVHIKPGAGAADLFSNSSGPDLFASKPAADLFASKPAADAPPKVSAADMFVSKPASAAPPAAADMFSSKPPAAFPPAPADMFSAKPAAAPAPQPPAISAAPIPAPALVAVKEPQPAVAAAAAAAPAAAADMFGSQPEVAVPPPRALPPTPRADAFTAPPPAAVAAAAGVFAELPAVQVEVTSEPSSGPQSQYSTNSIPAFNSTPSPKESSVHFATQTAEGKSEAPLSIATGPAVTGAVTPGPLSNRTPGPPVISRQTSRVLFSGKAKVVAGASPFDSCEKDTSSLFPPSSGASPGKAMHKSHNSMSALPNLMTPAAANAFESRPASMKMTATAAASIFDSKPAAAPASSVDLFSAPPPGTRDAAPVVPRSKLVTADAVFGQAAPVKKEVVQDPSLPPAPPGVKVAPKPAVQAKPATQQPMTPTTASTVSSKDNSPMPAAPVSMVAGPPMVPGVTAAAPFTVAAAPVSTAPSLAMKKPQAAAVDDKHFISTPHGRVARPAAPVAAPVPAAVPPMPSRAAAPIVNPSVISSLVTPVVEEQPANDEAVDSAAVPPVNAANVFGAPPTGPAGDSRKDPNQFFAIPSAPAAGPRPISYNAGSVTAAAAMGERRHVVGRAPCPVVAFGFGGKFVTMFPVAQTAANPLLLTAEQKAKPYLPNSIGVHRLADLLKESPAGAGDYVRAEHTQEKQILHQLLTSFGGPCIPSSGTAKAIESKLASLEPKLQAFIQERMRQPVSQLRNDDASSIVQSEKMLWSLLQLLMELNGYASAAMNSDDSSSETRIAQLLLSFANNTAASLPAAGNNVAPLLELLQLHQQYPLTAKEHSGSKADNHAAIEHLLLLGQREEALVKALDCQEWTLALLISCVVSNDKYQEVVRNYANAHFPQASPLYLLMMTFSNQATNTIMYGGGGVNTAGKKFIAHSAAAAAGEDGKKPVPTATLLTLWKQNLAALLSNKSSDWRSLVFNLGHRMQHESKDVYAAHFAYLCGEALPSYPPGPAAKPSPPAPSTTGGAPLPTAAPAAAGTTGTDKAPKAKPGQYSLLGCDMTSKKHRVFADVHSISALRMTEVLECIMVRRSLNPQRKGPKADSKGDSGKNDGIASSIGKSLSGMFRWGGEESSSGKGSDEDARFKEYVSRMRAVLCPLKIRFAMLLADFGLVSEAMAYAVEARALIQEFGIDDGSASSSGGGKTPSKAQAKGAVKAPESLAKPFNKRFVRDLEEFMDRLGVDVAAAAATATPNTSGKQQNATGGAGQQGGGFWGVITALSTSANLKDFVDGPETKPQAPPAAAPGGLYSGVNAPPPMAAASPVPMSIMNPAAMSGAPGAISAPAASTPTAAFPLAAAPGVSSMSSVPSAPGVRSMPPASTAPSRPMSMSLPPHINVGSTNMSAGIPAAMPYPGMAAPPPSTTPQHASSPALFQPPTGSTTGGMSKSSSTADVMYDIDLDSDPASSRPYSYNASSQNEFHDQSQAQHPGQQQQGYGANSSYISSATMSHSYSMDRLAGGSTPQGPGTTTTNMGGYYIGASASAHSTPVAAQNFPRTHATAVQEQNRPSSKQNGSGPPSRSESTNNMAAAGSKPPASSAGIKDPTSAPTGGLVGKVRKGLLNWFYPDAHDATDNIGGGLEAYYDENLKKWVFPGEDPTAASEPLPPPPIMPAAPSAAGGAMPPPSMGPGSGPPTGASTPVPDAPYDPLAAMMAPPSRRIPSYPPSSVSSNRSDDPLAAMMAPPPRSTPMSMTMMSSDSSLGLAGPPPSSKPAVNVWKPPPAPASTISTFVPANFAVPVIDATQSEAVATEIAPVQNQQGDAPPTQQQPTYNYNYGGMQAMAAPQEMPEIDM